MSRSLYDFLHESFLFREVLREEDLAPVRSADLAAELRRYREHVLAARGEIEAEISARDQALSVFFDTLSRPARILERLKQCAFYFDFVVADDPLFALSQEPDPMARAPTELLGYKQPELDPKEVASAARYMKDLVPMVGADFLKFSPVSLDHEPSAGIPFRVSGNFFSEDVPPELHPFFRDRARVYSMHRRDDGGWSFEPGGPLEPSRGIWVEFDGLEQAYFYHLFETRVLHADEETHTITAVNTLPDTPPDPARFGVWVAQSTNQAAGHVLRAVLTDLARASASNSMVCTGSTLVRDLVSQRAGAENLETDLANLALELEVPTLSGATIADLMEVRINEGEAFLNFRAALQRELRELRRINDPDERRRRLEEVGHEFEVSQLTEVRAQARKAARGVVGEGALGTATMAAAFYNPNATFFLLLAAALAAGRASYNLLNELRAHPAYFLWQVSRRG